MSLNSGNASEVANCGRPRLASATQARERDQRLRSTSRNAPPKPRGGLLRHLQIVVVESDAAEAERDARARSRHRGCADWPTAAVDTTMRDQDHQPAHGRRAGLDEVRLRPVGADRLALALPDAQVVDDPGPEQEHEDQRGHHRAAGAHREVAEHVEDRERAGKVGQPVEHRFNLVPAPRRRRDGNIGGSAP